MEEIKCPKCGEKLLQYLYGLVPDEDLDLDKYVIGGCEIIDGSPVYVCKKCKKNFDKDLKELGDCE